MIKAEYDKETKAMRVNLKGVNNTILNEFSAIVFKINEVASRSIGEDGARIMLKEAFNNGLKLEITDENTLELKKDDKNEQNYFNGTLNKESRG